MAPGSGASYEWTGGRLVVRPVMDADGASFAGLPVPAEAIDGVPSDRIRFAGGASLILKEDNQTILQVASFAFGDNPQSSYAQSTVAFLSRDGGKHFTYASTIAAARDYPWSQEGPGGELDLALLPSAAGKPPTIACVLRVDGGDGPRSHPYRPFMWTTSTDMGRT